MENAEGGKIFVELFAVGSIIRCDRLVEVEYEFEDAFEAEEAADEDREDVEEADDVDCGDCT